MHLSLRELWRDYRGLVVFMTLLFCFRGALADWNVVPTESMRPTLVEGDVILVNRVAYDLKLPFSAVSLYHRGEPRRGDIVVFDSAARGRKLVKRVIGLPGDEVSLSGNRLILNGQETEYRLVHESGEGRVFDELLPGREHRMQILNSPAGRRADFRAVTVPPGQYLVLGDNRDNSADSRFIGFVPRREISGRAHHVIVSFDADHYFLPRPDRIFSELH